MHTYRASLFRNLWSESRENGWLSKDPLSHIATFDTEAANPEQALAHVRDHDTVTHLEPGDVIALHMRDHSEPWMLHTVAAYAIKVDGTYDTITYRAMNVVAPERDAQA